MAARPLRVGVVGATAHHGGSGWGGDAHVPSLHALPQLELAAVCTSNAQSAAAAAELFAAPLAFHDIREMAEHPDVDLVAVALRVPSHREAVLTALAAGKPVLCEWPLGATSAEAREMAGAAAERGLPGLVGLQARSDPHVRYARDLVASGYIGELQLASLVVHLTAMLRRRSDRIWQSDPALGANPLTIQTGHALDATCFIIGELTDVSARTATKTREWLNVDTGESVEVATPDTIGVLGVSASGVELAVQGATVPEHGQGTRLTLHGTEGVLVLEGSSIQVGPNRLYGGRRSESFGELHPPGSYTPQAELIPDGRATNVARAYQRIASAFGTGEPFDPDFATAVQRHRTIDAVLAAASSGQQTSVALG